MKLSRIERSLTTDLAVQILHSQEQILHAHSRPGVSIQGTKPCESPARNILLRKGEVGPARAFVRR
jgi:hypothetical protein